MRTTILFVMALGAVAQPRTTDIGELLASKEPWDLALGARLAGDGGQGENAPRIIGLLNHTDWQVRMAAFDALIRLRANVEDAVLAPLAKEHFEPVVILAWQHLPQHQDPAAWTSATSRPCAATGDPGAASLRRPSGWLRAYGRPGTRR